MLPDHTAKGIRKHGVDLAECSEMAAAGLVAALVELAVSADGDNGERIRIHCG